MVGQSLRQALVLVKAIGTIYMVPTFAGPPYLALLRPA